MNWPDHRIQDLFAVDVPIIQAPMAGYVLSDMVSAVSEAGGLGSLPCALLNPDQLTAELYILEQTTGRPYNLNFFCHRAPEVNASREQAWKMRLSHYYKELSLEVESPVASSSRTVFDEAMCDRIAEFHPAVISFHFGLPNKSLVMQAKMMGAKIVSSATTVQEAQWLEQEGCDAIIAQGYEAGGHRGMFLSQDLSTQVGTMALVPQIVDAVRVPVIAAGGIADARGIAAAFVLGASAVQLGTAYLFCQEARVSAVHRKALQNARDNYTGVTNVFTGRPARGIANRIIREVGPMSDLAPEFPTASGAIAPLRSKSEQLESEDFVPMWSGQAASLSAALPAGELTRKLAAEALAKLNCL